MVCVPSAAFSPSSLHSYRPRTMRSTAAVPSTMACRFSSARPRPLSMYAAFAAFLFPLLLVSSYLGAARFLLLRPCPAASLPVLPSSRCAFGSPLGAPVSPVSLRRRTLRASPPVAASSPVPPSALLCSCAASLLLASSLAAISSASSRSAETRVYRSAVRLASPRQPDLRLGHQLRECLCVVCTVFF